MIKHLGNGTNMLQLSKANFAEMLHNFADHLASTAAAQQYRVT